MSDPTPNNHSSDASWVRMIKMIVVAFGYQVTSILIGAVAPFPFADWPSDLSQ
ncbi:hypothetical protein [Rhodoferax aquaticus]|uniref:hypothetical protein n=1 Tax=Rhodoferax aquaticus TaxID=2527691 RepID=UPI00143CD76A|nr:hypothetical protein [Rhodoferax aquaticus]